MKIRILLTTFSLLFIAFVFMNNSGGRASAANSGNTGAPGESTTCVTCHNSGNAYNPTLNIEIFDQGTTNPITQYSPGSIYDMKVTINNSMGSPAGYGFQMVSLTSSNNSNAGAWSNLSSNTKSATLGSGRSYVEHSGVGSNNTFTMSWTAPMAGSGDVKFYAAGNAINGNGSTSGDNSDLHNITITEAVTTVTADAATGLSLSDIGDAGNGSDIEITFNKASNENTVGSYRVMLVKQTSASAFNLMAAQGVSSMNYTSITPNGNATYTQALMASTTDTDGDVISNGMSYVMFVLSVADGANANVDALSAGSSPLTLIGIPDVVTNVVGTDIANAGDGSDVEYTFSKASNEATLTEYRVMVVDSMNASSFDLTAAQAVNVFNYTVVSPSGMASYTGTLASDARDVDGDLIASDMPYQIFVLSANTTDNKYALSASSNTFTLEFPINTFEVTPLQANLTVINQQLQVRLNDNTDFENLQLNIFDINGRLLKKVAVRQTNFGVNLNEYPNGIYLVQITNGFQQWTGKIIK